jgi:hypothetical protein
MQIRVYPEFHESRSEDLKSYLKDKLYNCWYDSGELEAIKDRINNITAALAVVLERLVEKKILSLKDIEKIVSNCDKIGKDESE